MSARILCLFASLLLTSCAAATGVSTGPTAPTPTGAIGPATTTSTLAFAVDVSALDNATPVAAGVPWGLDRAPRMPFDAPRIAEVFAALPSHIGPLSRSPAENPARVSYADQQGNPAVVLYAVPYNFLETAPALVERAATELHLISAADASELDASGRILFVAGGLAGADPPVHALVWAYSDRGHGFVLLAASPADRRLVVETLVATLTAFDPAILYSAGPREGSATCTTNAAGDNLKC